jgi:uncharacterized protein YoxC
MERKKTLVDKITTGVGSIPSLIIHTLMFIGFFTVSIAHIVSWDTMFLSLTTIVSLEAIYLAIFIQISVNRQSLEIAEVNENVDDIQEDIEEISQDMDEIQKDVEEISQDVDEIQKDVDEIQEDVGDIQEDVEDIQEDIGDTEETPETTNNNQQSVTLEFSL